MSTPKLEIYVLFTKYIQQCVERRREIKYFVERGKDDVLKDIIRKLCENIYVLVSSCVLVARIVKITISEGKMIRGAQKNMIVIKTSDSDLFEEAYFVLRRERTARDKDIVAEANRIIETSGGKRCKGEAKNEVVTILWAAACFLCGTVTGACFGAIIFFA